MGALQTDALQTDLLQTDPLLSTRAWQDVSAGASKLESTSANLFTRAGTSLTGVKGGSSSVGDFNGDGNLDLVITGQDDSRSYTARVYLGDGAGGFFGAGAGLEGVYASSSSTGDFNGDGNLDLVITGDRQSLDPTARVYLGDGAGGFSETGAGLAGVSFGSSSVGDFDEDGNLDIVITGQSEPSGISATVYLGDGNGGFSAANANLTGVYLSSSSVGDVNGDGHLDLVITGEDSNRNRTATVYLGDGSGGFADGSAGLTGVREGSSSIADVNDDGNLDVLITGEDDSNRRTATVYLGDGTGGFSEAGAGLTGVSSSASSIADVDGDERPDLVIIGLDDRSDPSAAVYLGDGTGGFAPADAGLSPVTRSSVSVGDVDNDGDLDLVTSGRDDAFGRFSTRLYVNRLAQTPPNQTPVVDVPTFPEAVASGRTIQRLVEAGDRDGDRLSLTLQSSLPGVTLSDAGNGVAELTVAPTPSQAGQTLSMTVQVDDGRGGTNTATASVNVGDDFAVADAGLTALRNSSAATGDFNGDGNLDLVTIGQREQFAVTTKVYLGDGSGGFTEAGAALTDVFVGSVSVGDLDADGNLDLVITGYDSSMDPTATLYRGDGTGGFTPAGAGLTGVARSSSSLGDFNNDGHLDVVLTGEDISRNRTATVYLSDGTGGFTSAGQEIDEVYDGSSSVGDFNGDGNLDLVITGSERDGVIGPGARVYLGDGTGAFSEAAAGLNGVANSSSSVADFNEDGNLDVVTTGFDGDGNTAAVYLGGGDGTFTEASAGLTGVRYGSSLAEDFNVDGTPDLVIIGRDSNTEPTATVYLGDGNGNFSNAFAGLGEVGEGSVSAGDFNADGTLDLVITGTLTATFYKNLRGDPIPVELAAFEAVRNQRGLLLQWTTASETNNAGFHVEHRGPEADAFAPVGFVDGNGTTVQPQSYRFRIAEADPGRHRVRLRQVDTDGTETLSEVVDVEIGLGAAYVLSAPAPNPSRHEATLNLRVEETQRVQVHLFNVLGQRVAMLHDGSVHPGRSLRLRVGGDALASGAYFVRVVGEQFRATRRLTIVR